MATKAKPSKKEKKVIEFVTNGRHLFHAWYSIFRLLVDDGYFVVPSATVEGIKTIRQSKEVCAVVVLSYLGVYSTGLNKFDRELPFVVYIQAGFWDRLPSRNITTVLNTPNINAMSLHKAFAAHFKSVS